MPGCNEDLSFGYIGVPFLKGDQQNSNHVIQVTLPAENRLFSSFGPKVYLLRDLLATAFSHKNINKKTKMFQSPSQSLHPPSQSFHPQVGGGLH